MKGLLSKEVRCDNPLVFKRNLPATPITYITATLKSPNFPYKEVLEQYNRHSAYSKIFILLSKAVGMQLLSQGYSVLFAGI